MATSKKEPGIHKESVDNRLDQAQSDFKRLMNEVEPFIKKSEILLTSTEGKWYDTTSASENILVQNSCYHL